MAEEEEVVVNELRQRIEHLLGSADLFEERYRIGEAVGAGAYGTIVRAVDEETGESVAIKAIPPQARQRSETAIARFRREMKVVRRLDHPNIIAIEDWGRTDEGLIYMVLEFVDGACLDDVVRHDPMDAPTAVATTRQIARALEAAHDTGVIHRDLKPANVMLVPVDDGYNVKVLDFGMAKVLEPLDDEPVVDLTSEGMAVGTPRYIAPEQARGKEIGPQADLYAVGLLMYEMFTGVQVVQTDSVETAVAAHVSPEPLELANVEDVPGQYRPIVRRLLEKKPDRRFRSARRLIEALDDPGGRWHPEVAKGATGQIGPPLGDLTGDFPAAGGRQQPDEIAGQLPGTEESKPDINPGELAGLDASLEDGDELEIDLEDVDRRPGGGEEMPGGDDSDSSRGDVGVRRQRGQTSGGMGPRWFRPPREPIEWLEAGVSAWLLVAAVAAVGAQAGGLSFGPRLTVSLVAPMIALGWSTASSSQDWSRSFGRRCWICCLIAVIVAHSLGPVELATELTRNPAWFLRPVEGLPGMDHLTSAVTWASRHWAGILFDLFGHRPTM